jgi:hypothetical protein
MQDHYLSPPRLFVAGFLLFLVAVGALIGGVGPLVAVFLGEAKAAGTLLVVGLGTGVGGGLVFGLLLAVMGRTKTVCLSTRDSGVLQLVHDFLAKQGYTAFAQSPSGTTYCAMADAQAYGHATASRELVMRLFRFVAKKLCGIVPAAFYVHVTEHGDGLHVSGPAQFVHRFERDLRAHGVAASRMRAGNGPV